MEVFGIDGYYSPNYAGSGAYVAFTPEQIKSATDNSGTFGSGNADIRFSVQERELADSLDNTERMFSGAAVRMRVGC